MIAILALILPSCLAGAAHKRAKPSRAEVRITLGASTVKVPSSFLGISTEYWTVPVYERRLLLFERVVSLLRVRGDGPMMLRVGGDSADLTYWNPDLVRPSAGAFVLTPGWFKQTARLVTQLHLRVILDLNLMGRLPHMAAVEARAAVAHLPAGSIQGFEIGNEPDRFGNGYSADDYVRDFRSYARALKRVAPRVALMGPAVTSTRRNFNWLYSALADDRSELGVLTGHRYSLNACSKPTAPGYPTIARTLDESSSVGMARSVSNAVGLAHHRKRPFRLDELNSVTCGGLAGVSDTFATALWAPDALFALLSTGLDGLNLHIRPDKINSPFRLTSRGLEARPLLYGLILFARTIGHGGRLVQLHGHATRSAGLKAWAVQIAANKVHVLLINKSTEPVNVDLQLPSMTDATVERLRAPSARATAGVTFDGQRLGPNASWLGQRVAQRIRRKATGYWIAVPRFSAALVSVQLVARRR